MTRSQSGEQLKLAGIEKALAKHGPDMVRAQLVAQMLGMDGSLVTADAVREEFQKHYQRSLKVGNALGSLFLDRKWELVGFVRSKRRESHSRMIRTWRLKEHYQKKPQPFEVGTENGIRFCLTCGKETEACQCELKSESNQTN